MGKAQEKAQEPPRDEGGEFSDFEQADMDLAETKKPDKGRKKQESKDQQLLVEELGPCMANAVLRIAPRLYKDKTDQEKEEKEAKEGKDEQDDPKPPSSKKHASPSPPPAGGVKQMQAAGLRQPAEAQGDATTVPAKRTTYGGTLEGGRFQRNA